MIENNRENSNNEPFFENKTKTNYLNNRENYFEERINAIIQEISSEKNDLITYYTEILTEFTPLSQMKNLVAIHQLFSNTNKSDPKEITIKDLEKFYTSSLFLALSDGVKARKLLYINRYFEFCGREDLFSHIKEFQKKFQTRHTTFREYKTNDRNNEYYDFKIKELLDELSTPENQLKKYYVTDLNTKAKSTIRNHLANLQYFFKIIGKKNPENITEDDILNFLSNEHFVNLNPKTKNNYKWNVKAYFNFINRSDLVKLFKGHHIKTQTINKNELLTRGDIDKILPYCSTKEKVLFMLLYESGARRAEIWNVRFRDIEFLKNYTNLYISKSKTQTRNIPLVECTPYIKEYFKTRDFNENERILGMMHPGSIGTTLRRIKKRLVKIYPELSKKRFNPHALRHARLTELARTKLNQPQITKIAGWVPGSNMAKIYFHLDDSDVINILTDGRYTQPLMHRFAPLFCPICGHENDKHAIYCSRCSAIFNKKRFLIEKLNEEEQMAINFDKVYSIEKELREVREKLERLLK